MPNIQRTYKVRGKQGRRKIPYRQLSIREHDWYNVHKLAEKLNLSLADTIGVLVQVNMKAQGLEPLTAARLFDLEIPIETSS